MYLVIWEDRDIFVALSLSKELLRAHDEGVCDILSVGNSQAPIIMMGDCSWQPVTDYEELVKEVPELRGEQRPEKGQ